MIARERASMAETLLARRPALDLPPLSLGGARLRAAPTCARFILRGEESLATIGALFGIDVPTAPCRANRSGARAALWLGPDEWLLIAPEEETAEIAAALAPLAGALVEVSHRQVALLIEGQGAALALAGGVPLDLDVAAFPVGMAARTLFAKAEIVLWRTEPQEFRLEVLRSFAPYVWQSLELILKQNAAETR
jgi:sarcosine oxidase subunit gamma